MKTEDRIKGVRRAVCIAHKAMREEEARIVAANGRTARRTEEEERVNMQDRVAAELEMMWLPREADKRRSRQRSAVLMLFAGVGLILWGLSIWSGPVAIVAGGVFLLFLALIGMGG